MLSIASSTCTVESPSSRRAWIEIARGGAPAALPLVALLAEGVDRNHWYNALDAEGAKVALLAEGVDRNADRAGERDRRVGSPSSRRAWIEITGTTL